MSESKSTLSAERLREVLDYDPETGEFRWKVNTSPGKAGTVAGGINSKGYRSIGLDRCYYNASRLAWLYVHGTLPCNQIDHINGVRTDNRIANLRDVPVFMNNQNRRSERCVNSCGLIGVETWKLVGRTRFSAAIQVRNRRIYLGRYDTPEEAHAAYLAAKRRLHEGCTI